MWRKFDSSKLIHDRKIIFLKILLYIVAVFSLFILSFFPSLVASGEAPFYRCITGLVTIIILLIVWAILQILSPMKNSHKNTLLTVVLLAGASLGIFKAYNNILSYRIIPSKMEWNFVLNKMKQADLNHYKRIHIIRPDISILNTRYDEFITPTTYYSQDILGVVSSAINELTKEKYKIFHIDFNYRNNLATYFFIPLKGPKKIIPYQIIVTSGLKDELLENNPSILTIDMNDLYKPTHGLHYLTLTK